MKLCAQCEEPASYWAHWGEFPGPFVTEALCAAHAEQAENDGARTVTQ